MTAALLLLTPGGHLEGASNLPPCAELGRLAPGSARLESPVALIAMTTSPGVVVPTPASVAQRVGRRWPYRPGGVAGRHSCGTAWTVGVGSGKGTFPAMSAFLWAAP
jgi:hypothetical protein